MKADAKAFLAVVLAFQRSSFIGLVETNSKVRRVLRNFDGLLGWIGCVVGMKKRSGWNWSGGNTGRKIFLPGRIPPSGAGFWSLVRGVAVGWRWWLWLAGAF